MELAGFEQQLQADGYAEIETKSLAPQMHNAEHDHPFDVRALVIEGQIALTVAGETRTYGEGEIFTMASGCRHAEQIGPRGVRYLVGRRRSLA